MEGIEKKEYGVQGKNFSHEEEKERYHTGNLSLEESDVLTRDVESDLHRSHPDYLRAFSFIEEDMSRLNPAFLIDETFGKIGTRRHLEGLENDYQSDPWTFQHHVPFQYITFLNEWSSKAKELLLLDDSNRYVDSFLEFIRQWDSRSHSLAISDQIEFLERMCSFSKSEAIALCEDSIQAKERLVTVEQNIEKLLGGIVKQKIGTFFLSLTAQSIKNSALAAVDEVRNMDYLVNDHVFSSVVVKPFLLTENKFALLHREGGLPILIEAPEHSTEDLRQLLERRGHLLEKLNQSEVEKFKFATSVTVEDVEQIPEQSLEDHSQSEDVTKEVIEIEGKIRSFFFLGTLNGERRFEMRADGEAIPEQVVNLRDSLSMGSEDLMDGSIPRWSFYETIFSRHLREAFKKEADVTLSKLTVREQMHFFIFAAHTPASNTEDLMGFVRTYKENGLRAFLANAYDENASERILTFASLTDEQTAKPIFDSYGKILDASEQLVTETGKAMPHEDAALLRQLSEAMVRRSAHLFFGAERIALGDGYQEGNPTMSDLKYAMGGLEKTFDVLADISKGERYEFSRTRMNESADTFGVTIMCTEKDSGQQYPLKLFVRPRQSSEGEARVNIEFSLDALPQDDPLRKAFWQQTVYHEKKKTVETSVVRLGLDLDTHTDPPTFSFDMGRDANEAESFSRTGDALGNILARYAPEGHHLTEAFSKDLSDPETFARIAGYLREYFKSRFA